MGRPALRRPARGVRRGWTNNAARAFYLIFVTDAHKRVTRQMRRLCQKPVSRRRQSDGELKGVFRRRGHVSLKRAPINQRPASLRVFLPPSTAVLPLRETAAEVTVDWSGKGHPTPPTPPLTHQGPEL